MPFIDQDRDARSRLEASRADLARFFRPDPSIAIIGRVDASPVQRRLFARYGGGARVCFVNPKGGDAGDIPVYRSIAELPDHVTVALVKVGAAGVADVVRACAARGIRNLVVFSSGFAETGAEGAAHERRLAEAVRETGVRVIGPNTTDNMFELLPRPPGHRGGLIGLITQSGANGRPLVEGTALGAGFTRWVTAGNEVDLEFADYLNHFAFDPDTRVIAGYIEGFKSIPRLRVALEAAGAQGKPVVFLKIGSTEQGARMAASHTGHLAGSDAVIQGLFDQHGVTRVDDLDELLETANLFAKLPADTGPRAALYSVSGGTATLMAELASQAGVPVPPLAETTRAALHRHLPGYVSVANPVDNGGQFTMLAPQDQRLAVFDALAADPAVDVIVVGFNAAFGLLSDNMAADVLAWAPTAPKPVVAVWSSVVTDGAGYADLVRSGVPILRSLKKCFRALAARERWRRSQAAWRRRPGAVPDLTARQAAALAGPGVLPGPAAADLLADAGVPLAGERLVAGADAAVAAAAALGFPVALKLISPDFPHKTDLGLVRLDLADGPAVAAAHDALLAHARALDPAARIDGVLVQQQVGRGVEMLVGLSADPQVGPALTIGAGGIHAEILRDVAVRPLPVDEGDVREMIAGLRCAPLLAGARGAPPADTDALVRLALAVARLGLAAEGRLAELDLNPVIVRPDGAVAVDCLAVAGGTP
jgi:acyl-CoA synthetase (NDP forming)